MSCYFICVCYYWQFISNYFTYCYLYFIPKFLVTLQIYTATLAIHNLTPTWHWQQISACDILIATVRIDITGNYNKLYRGWHHVRRTCKFHLTPWYRANDIVNSNSSHEMVSLAELHTWPHNWKGPLLTSGSTRVQERCE